MSQIELDLACQGLYWIARGMDLTDQKSWDALMTVADCIAKKFPSASQPLDVLLEIERGVK